MDTASAIPIATDFIATQESFSGTAYFDVNGYAIGYGNHYYEDGSAVSEGDTISEDDALSLLGFYVSQNMTAIVNQLTVDQNADQLAALTSIRYNCGTITTALLNLINSGADPGTIGSQIEITCTTSGGVSDPVLIARRQLEAALYQSTGMGAATGLLLIAGVGLAVYIMFIKK
jgi:GH24 family phage-related lysozyme (muramidase)